MESKFNILYEEILGKQDNIFNYQLLSRLESDCKYFLNNPYEKHLWAGNIDGQIEKMKELYNGFSDDKKPEWISLDIINEYEKNMKNKLGEA